jgi:hypothetical protein
MAGVVNAATTTVASRVLSGEQQAALTVECTKPSTFRQVRA